jgi:lipoyl(octanoyl) transferase
MVEDYADGGTALRVYLLGSLPYEEFLAFQRRLVYEVGGEPELGALVVCEHPPIVTIGRDGSRRHVRLAPETMAGREWRQRYVARGGGTMLHVPGQVCAYPVLPLTSLRRTPGDYLRDLLEAVHGVVASYGVEAAIDADRPGLRVGDRRVAHAGIAVRSGVTAFGLVLNVCPDLELFDTIACDGDPKPMTSLERESPRRVRLASARVQLADAIAARFGYSRQTVLHSHNNLHANAHRR